MQTMRHPRATRLAVVLVAAAGIGAAGAAAAHASSGAAASVPRCRLHQLSLAQPKLNGAAGTIRLRFVFTNTSGSTCKLFGFPGMQMLNKNHNYAGAALAAVLYTALFVPFTYFLDRFAYRRWQARGNVPTPKR